MTPFGPASPFGSVFRLAEPRRRLIERVLDVVEHNAARHEAPLQHVLITGPRGSGKTVVLGALRQELAQAHFSARVAADLPAPIALQAAVPESLLERVASAVEDDGRTDLHFPWRSGDEAEWEAALARLDAALDARFGRGEGLAVLLVDDLEAVLRRVFPNQEAESRLRRLLQDHPRLMVIAATHDAELQSDYDRPLFQIFEPVELPPFNLTEAIGFIRGDEDLTPQQRVNLQAVYTLLGTSQPRRLLLTAHLAASTASASHLLRAVCDAESGAFSQTLDRLPSRQMRLLDALVAGGEPARPAELARRLATQQNDIAPTVAALLQSDVLARHRGTSGRMIFYQVADRAFACWYAYSRSDQGTLALAAVEALAAGLLADGDKGLSPSMRQGRKAALDALKTPSRAVAFKTLWSSLAPPGDAEPAGAAWFSACAELIREPADPRLLLDLAGTLAARQATTRLAALLDAAALTPFLDPTIEGRIDRPLNLDKDRIAHPDVLTIIHALRGEIE